MKIWRKTVEPSSPITCDNLNQRSSKRVCLNSSVAGEVERKTCVESGEHKYCVSERTNFGKMA